MAARIFRQQHNDMHDAAFEANLRTSIQEGRGTALSLTTLVKALGFCR
jgi:hypothetical protein